MDASELASTLPYLRRETARLLDRRDCTGEWLEPDPVRGCESGCWVHRAEGADPRPVVFELHGGGFALGDARTGDTLRSWICDTFEVNVVGVEYRLAPEHPFPDALHDVAGTVRRIVAGDELAIEPGRTVLMGYSAGANLAAAYALLAQRTDDLPLAAGLALHYPCLDVSERFRDCDEGGASLDADAMAAYSDCYAGGHDQRDPLVSPLYADDAALAAFPKTVIAPVVGDVLFGQSERFCTRLRANASFHNDRVVWQPIEGVAHGYIEKDLDTARKRNFVAAAVVRSLEPLLGPARHQVPFPVPQDSE